MKPVHSTLLFTCLIPMMLSGCSGGGSDSDDRLRGQVTPNGIRGLSYQTASQTGVTDNDGSFRYYPGESLQISVGDLQLVSGVPASDIVTPLEFLPEIRAQLASPALNDEGLLDHRLTEQALLEDTTLMNMTRFLLSLNWEVTVQDDESLEIRDRVLEQLNEALPELDAAIDFAVSTSEFEASSEAGRSPANQLLEKICFFEEDDDRCDEPPTQAEIDAAPERPDDDDDIDPDIEYREDLISKRNRILGGQRQLDDVDLDAAKAYLTRELDAATRLHANRYTLTPETAAYPATDTGIKQVRVRKIGGGLALGALEAVSLRDADVAIHSYDWQSGTVEYFINGEAGGESDVLVNFQPEDDYRWIRKQLRVIIEE